VRFETWFRIFTFAILSGAFFGIAALSKKMIRRSEEYAELSRTYFFPDFNPFFLRLIAYAFLAAIPVAVFLDLRN